MPINKSVDELAQREDKLFAERDQIENNINEIIGLKLNRTQLLMLRTQFERLDKCDEAIERVKERIQEKSGALV